MYINYNFYIMKYLLLKQMLNVVFCYLFSFGYLKMPFFFLSKIDCLTCIPNFFMHVIKFQPEAIKLLKKINGFYFAKY